MPNPRTTAKKTARQEKPEEPQRFYGASPNDKVSLSDLHKSYNDWAKINGKEIMNAQKFGKSIRQTLLSTPFTVEKGNVDGKKGVMLVRGLKKYPRPDDENKENIPPLLGKRGVMMEEPKVTPEMMERYLRKNTP